jgi:aspartyl-tRNA synthetase
VVSGPAALRRLPHAGFGLGFERMVMYLTGVSNIRDVLPHPRTVGSADFYAARRSKRCATFLERPSTR